MKQATGQKWDNSLQEQSYI